MLMPPFPPLRVGGLGLALDRPVDALDAAHIAQCSVGAPLLELAAAALELTLREGGIERREVSLVLFACDAFDADRSPGAAPDDRGALLDNDFNASVVRRLLLEHELLEAQPHGVFLAEGLGLCAGLAAARGFLLGEPMVRDIVLVTAEGATPGRRRASACLVTRREIGGLILDGIDLVTSHHGMTSVARPSGWRGEILHARPSDASLGAPALLHQWSHDPSRLHVPACIVVQSGRDGLGLAHFSRPAQEPQ